MTPGPGDTAYVHSVNDQPIHRVKGDRVSTASGPVDGSGLAALAALPGLLRVVAGDGQLYDSVNDGLTWQRTGELSKQHNKHDGIPSLAFNPADPTILYLGLAEER